MRIVLKLPDNHLEQVCAIPFIYKLDEIYEHSEIHLIVAKKYSDYLSLIPIDLYVHTYTDELNHPLDAHRVAAELKVAEVDLFFSLSETLTDNSFGKWLRAKQSIGFGEGLKSIVLDHKMLRPTHLHFCDMYLKLLELIPTTIEDEESIVDTSFDRFVRSKELEPVIKDYDTEPYLIMNIPFDHEKNCFSYDWIDFFEYLNGQKIYFISDQCPRNRFNILINDFILRLPEKNTYLGNSLNVTEFASMVAFSKGFITPDSFLAHISSYVGAKSLILYDKEADKRAPIYTSGDCFLITKEEILLTHGLKGKVSSELNIGDIFDHAHDFFALEKVQE